ncbi:MAG: hypothetical protein K6F04_03135 [bacterium]|nr:hypothetical protein [bacterium]
MRCKYEIKDTKGYIHPCDIYETGIDIYEIVVKTGLLTRENLGRYSINELVKLRDKGILLEIPLSR